MLVPKETMYSPAIYFNSTCPDESLLWTTPWTRATSLVQSQVNIIFSLITDNIVVLDN